MSRRAAAGGLGLAVLVAVALLGVGPAGAATEVRLSPASGPPGTEFVITGTGFAPGVVELHWGSQSGPVIATAMGPDFSVPATVPDSPPNSHPVVAVVTEGGSVSTSSASFQVTAATDDAPPTTITTIIEATPTTVAEAPAGTTTVPQAVTGPTERAAPSFNRGDVSGVDGGVDAGPTTASGDGRGTAGAGNRPAGSTEASSPGAPVTPGSPGDAGATATVPPPAGGPGGGGPGPATATAQPGGTSSDPRAPVAGAAEGAALGPRSTSQSAGAVSNPVLLVAGLTMVFGGGVFLAVRNRQRA